MRADTEAQLRAVQAAASGSDGGIVVVRLPIDGVLVTARKPVVQGAGPNDGPGFFVQAGDAGLFVEVDPGSLNPSPSSGDVVSFDVTRVSREQGQRRAKSIGTYSRLGINQPLPTPLDLLRLNLTFLNGSRDAVESVLVRGQNTVTSASWDGGVGGYGEVELGASLLQPKVVRLPTVLNDTEDLRAGCSVNAVGPLWLTPQPGGQLHVWTPQALTGTTCPPPQVVSVTSPSANIIEVDTSRFMAFSQPSASFIFSHLGAPAMAVASNTVNRIAPQRLSVSANLQRYWNYNVTIPANGSARDTRGTAMVPGPAFTFSAGGCRLGQGPVLITGVFASGSLSAVELHNRTSMPINLSGYSLTVSRGFFMGPITVGLFGALQPGGYFSVGEGFPADQFESNLNLDQTGGEVVLRAPATSQCSPAGDSVMWGSGFQTICGGALSPSLSIQRDDPAGCADQDSPSDWQRVGTSSIRTSATAPNVCACP